MPKPYKLRSEIEQFIISKKGENPKLSCRRLVSAIKEEFKVEISKSSINTVIKANNLSNRIGRPGIKPKPVSSPIPVEVPPLPEQEPASATRPLVRDEPVFEAVNFSSPPQGNVGFDKSESISELERARSIEFRSTAERNEDIENGGAIFLLMVDYKFGLTRFLAQKISVFLPGLNEEALRVLIQLKIYRQIIKDEAGLWKFLGKEPVVKDFNFCYEQLAQLPFDQLNADFAGLGLQHNINDINTLYQESLLCLNKKAQQAFFPSVYQFLDLSAMRERFYALVSRIERTDSLVTVQFLYPQKFTFIADIVWQDDFKFAISSINKERVFTPEGHLFKFEDTLAAYQ